MLSAATMGLDGTSPKKVSSEVVQPNIFAESASSTPLVDLEKAAAPNKLSATDRDVNFRHKKYTFSARETYLLEKKLARERLEKYSKKHLRGDIYALAKVQRSVIQIQRIMRGKLARKQYRSLMASRFALVELLLFLAYLTFHIWFAILRKDNVDMFYLSKMMEDAMIHEEFPGPAGGGETYIKKTFLDVAQVEEFWDYLEGPFRANVFPEKCRDPKYRGDKCLGTMLGYNHIVGTVRIRQYRVEETTGANCYMPEILKSRESIDSSPCVGSWDIQKESKNDYGMLHFDNTRSSWSQLQNNTYDAAQQGGKHGNFSECFKWEENEQKKSFFAGLMGDTISGGWVASDARLVTGTSWNTYPTKSGYTCDFHPTIDPLSKLQVLKEFNWVDQYTKAVLVEVTVYNKPTNLFSSMRLFFEFPRTGGIQPYYEPYTGYLFSFLKPWSFYQELFVLFIIDAMTLGFVFQEFSVLRREGICGYFSSLWNLLDWFNYIALGAMTWMFVNATLEAHTTLGMPSTDTTDTEYIAVQSLVYKYRYVDYIFSINMIFVFLKMLKYVRLSPKLSIVSETLTSTISQSAGFFIIFLMLLASYALAFWFTYGQMIFEFRTLTNSFVGFLLFVYAILADGQVVE